MPDADIARLASELLARMRRWPPAQGAVWWLPPERIPIGFGGKAAVYLLRVLGKKCMRRMVTALPVGEAPAPFFHVVQVEGALSRAVGQSLKLRSDWQ